ncbi:MAG: penicillin-binding protein 2 [Ignavibacteria bacterium]|nr:penicillin-binding protein 2 [Ignavibacteria bacterium]
MDLAIKKYIIFSICFAILAILIGRLIQLQLLNVEEFGKKSQKNSVKIITDIPARGLMYDRNGKVVVDNKPAYSLMITHSQFNFDNLNEVANLIEVTPEYINEILSKVKGTNRFSPVKIKRDVEFRVISYIEENKERLRGVDYQVEALRFYPNTFKASHTFGYTKEISEKQLDKQVGNYYTQGDVMGSSGLERFYENYLRGEKGRKLVSVDVKGKEVGSYNDGKDDIKPVNGFDLLLSLDSELQEYAENRLGSRRGAIIALDPRTGEILCMVSKPDFDLSLFSGPTDSKVFADLLLHKDKPLFNRVVQSRQPPGSTWKMLMGFAGLGSGVITTTSTISCGGSFRYGNRTFEDHGAYGSINVTRAIEVSANVFFYKLGLKVGLDNYNKYGKMFGFGLKTGVDIPGEISGLLPSEEYFNKVYGPKGWTQGFLVSLGIGQGELGVTPVQMVAYTAAISMEGLYIQPHIVRRIVNPITGQEEILEFEQRRIELPNEYFKAIKKGMYLVVNGNGTAKNIRSSEFVLAGKTGTAQVTKGNNHSWFVGFAPYDNPQIAVCVLGENAGWGSQFAAPLAAAIMIRYLSGNTEDVYEEGSTVIVRD